MSKSDKKMTAPDVCYDWRNYGMNSSDTVLGCHLAKKDSVVLCPENADGI